MKRIGYHIIDIIVNYLDNLHDLPVSKIGNRQELEKKLFEQLPENGIDIYSVLEIVETDILSHISKVNHPRFFAYIPSPSNFISAMADTIASSFNVYSSSWLLGSGPAEIELITLDWLRQLYNFPETAGGLFVSGGSLANLTALAVARHVKLNNQINNAVIYMSDQTHSSVIKAFRLLGFQNEQIQILQSNQQFQIPIKDLTKKVHQDITSGNIPFCVIANAGTTNSAAVDPISELVPICQKENIWLHVDGAFGAASILSEEGQSLLKGIESVDSLTVDPHKWLFQPYEIGCVLLRNREHLKSAFHILPEYLKDMKCSNNEINFSDYGIQLTRGFRALKLWMSLKTFGLEAFKKAINYGIQLAKRTEEIVSALPDWEIVTPAQLGIVTFRYYPKGRSLLETNAINQEIVKYMTQDGYAMVSSTELKGKTVIRMCTINPRTTVDDIRETVKRLERFGSDINQQIT